MKAVQLIISGKVQGVGYRRWFEKQAQTLGLKGYVMNLPTGEVEAVIVGDDSQIEDMIQHSLIGPSRAIVVFIEMLSLQHWSTFTEFKMLR